MKSFDWAFNASLLSKERLMQARGFYTPTRGTLAPELEFSKWTQRVAQQSEPATARELAGLSDPELAVLEEEFVRSPTRRPSALRRHAVPLGLASLALGGVSLGLIGMSDWHGGALVIAQSIAIMLLGLGVGALAAGFVAAFSTMHLDLSHGTTGLLVGRLDDQHPWLYKTMALTCNPSAETYRHAVLRDRGCLRGLDYVTMKELVAVHATQEGIRSTKSVADQLQTPASMRLPTVVHQGIVRLAAPIEHRRRSTDVKLVEVPTKSSTSSSNGDDRDRKTNG